MYNGDNDKQAYKGVEIEKIHIDLYNIIQSINK